LLLVLLDANAIIGFHELGAWGQIIKQHEVYIPSIVLRNEAFFYRTVDGRRHPIDLLPSVGKSITELECTPDEIESFASRYNHGFLPEIHKGEQEALALLEKREDFLFCTCDGAALKVLGFMGLSERGISFETILKKTGLTKPLARKHSQVFFDEHVKIGQRLRIEHFGK
jgi:hypothetical protein